MEKEKPYKCDVCGKRYKNLNGLKYVKSSNVKSCILTNEATAQAAFASL